MSRPRFIALLLAFITLVVFLPVGWHQFVNYDDVDYVVGNPHVKNGLNWPDIQWAFTSFYASNWHPLTWISHMLDCELFGLNAGAQHLVNVLFHAANSALLFVWLWRLTQKLWPSTLVAALFAWHPLHVESVAWIAERKDVLSTFFALLSLLAYTRFAQAQRDPGNMLRAIEKTPAVALNLHPVSSIPHPSPSYLLALLFFTLGLLSKPMLVTLPCVLLLLDFWPLERIKNSGLKIENWKPLLAEKIPFFLLAAISCAFTFFAQKNGGAVVSLTKVPLPYRLENAPIAMVEYVLKLFWPTDLCAIYLLGRIFIWQAVLSVLILALISALVWRCRKTKPYLLFGWLWFLGTLVPVIGLVQVGSQSMADRYTYIPSIGFFIAVVFLVADFVARVQMPKAIIASSATLILLACISLTEFNLQFWRNSETLFRHAVTVAPDNVLALVDLGAELDAQHRFNEALVVYHQAEHFESAPYYQLHNNLGNILGLLGRHAESLAEYGIAIRQKPEDPKLHYSAGIELATLGHFDDALVEFATAEKLKPDLAAPHLEAAKIYLKQGRDAEAVNELHATARLAPDDFPVLAYISRVLAANQNAGARDGRAALLLASQANALANHTQPMVFDSMGMACAELGDFVSAQACAQKAIELATALHQPGLPELQQRLELYKNHQPWHESYLATNPPTK